MRRSDSSTCRRFCLILGVLGLAGLSRPALADGLQLSVGQGIAGLAFGGSDELMMFDLGSMTDLSTRLGYRFGSWVPFIGLDYASYGIEQQETDCWTDWEWNEDGETDVRRCETQKSDGDISLMTFQAGVRYLMAPWTEQKPHLYLTGALYLVSPSSDIQEDIDDALEETTSWGFLAGGGIEYVVSPHLSLSGEIGINRFSLSSEQEENDESYEMSLSSMSFYSSLFLTFQL